MIVNVLSISSYKIIFSRIKYKKHSFHDSDHNRVLYNAVPSIQRRVTVS